MGCTNCGRENREGARFFDSWGFELASVASTGVDTGTGISYGSDFVGRQGEMGELTSALDDALAGRGRMIMVAGEPGICKTRMALR